MSNRTQSALLGGLFIGVLSSLPLVNLGNACCCLWVVTGGLLSVYLRQQQQPLPIETGEALLTGLLAGAIGAALTIVASSFVLQVTGPMWQDQFREQIDANPDLPPQIREMLLNMMNRRGLALLQFAVTLPVFAIFSALGALLGAAIFRKKMPPAVPPVPPAAGV